MRRLLWLLPLLFLPALPAHAQLANAQGWCEAGAQSVYTSGLASTSLVQGSFPQCIVSVQIHGGGLATIYATGASQPLANPFQASTNGRWLFYVANGEYDITLSAVGMPTTTLSDIFVTNSSILGNNNTWTGTNIFQGPFYCGNLAGPPDPDYTTGIVCSGLTRQTTQDVNGFASTSFWYPDSSSPPFPYHVNFDCLLGDGLDSSSMVTSTTFAATSCASANHILNAAAGETVVDSVHYGFIANPTAFTGAGSTTETFEAGYGCGNLGSSHITTAYCFYAPAMSGSATIGGFYSYPTNHDYFSNTYATSIITPTFESIRFADQYSSVKSAYDSGPSTGVWVIVPAGACSTQTVQLVLTAGKPLHLSGMGQSLGIDAAGNNEPGTTCITWNTSGYWIDNASPTDVIDGVTIENMIINTGSTATGAIRSGSTATNYSNSNYRAGWHFSNITFNGPGATTVGSIGLSLTQLIHSQFDNITIRNYETPLIWDRGAASTWVTPRFWSFKYGPNITAQGGSGTAAAGGDGTKFIGGEILGPTTGSGTYSLTIDAQDITTSSMEWEVEVGSAAAAWEHVTANGANYRDNGSYFSLAGGATTPTNLLVWDTGYIAPKYFGTIWTGGATPAISAGTPNVGIAGNRAECIGCSNGSLFNAFLTVGNAAAIPYGQDANNNFQVAAGGFTYRGPSNIIVSFPTTTTGTISLLSTVQCGTLSVCSPTVETGKGQIVVGTIAFSASTTASITGMPTFTSATTYSCMLTDPSHAYTWLITTQTATGFTITAGTSNSDTWTYSCSGY